MMSKFAIKKRNNSRNISTKVESELGLTPSSGAYTYWHASVCAVNPLFNKAGWRPLVIVVALGALAACGGTASEENALDQLSSERLAFSTCPKKGQNAQRVDLNRDKKADVTHGQKDGKRFCSAYDLDFDGRADVIRFYGGDGRTPVREEHDFDFDGIIDQVSFYKGGRLQRKDLDTNFDGRVDARVWCQRGKVTKAVRDRQNDGYADTWELYKAGQVAQIRYDINGDGSPELAEMFSGGILQELRYDDDGDGKFDRRTKIPLRDAGAKEQPLACEVPLNFRSKSKNSRPTPSEKPPEGSPDLSNGPATNDAGTSESQSSEKATETEGASTDSESTEDSDGEAESSEEGGKDANSESSE